MNHHLYITHFFRLHEGGDEGGSNSGNASALRFAFDARTRHGSETSSVGSSQPGVLVQVGALYVTESGVRNQ